MALNTYSALGSAIASWLHRTDITSTIWADFITLAEARINRELRVREMETEATLTSTGVATIGLPSSFLEAKRVYHDASPLNKLEYITPEDYYQRYMSSTSGTPEAFTIEGDNMVVGPIPASGTTFKMLYYKQPPALSSTNHGLFLANPDLYLFGSLCEAQPYVKDDKRFPLWNARFEKVLQEAKAKDDRDRHSGSVLTIMSDYQVV